VIFKRIVIPAQPLELWIGNGAGRGKCVGLMFDSVGVVFCSSHLEMADSQSQSFKIKVGNTHALLATVVLIEIMKLEIHPAVTLCQKSKKTPNVSSLFTVAKAWTCIFA